MFSYRCGNYLICEGAIEGVVELSFCSCYFQNCLLALMRLLSVFVRFCVCVFVSVSVSRCIHVFASFGACVHGCMCLQALLLCNF